MEFLTHFYALFLESAPWLIIGLVLAGLLKVFIPSTWMSAQLGGSGLKPVVKAAFIGAPLPLCSCGVIPAAIGLRQAGASKAATTSFLVATPETGIDSLSVSYILLGPFMTIVRPISAIFSAVLAGLLVGKKDEKAATADQQPKKTSCCSSKKANNDEPIKIKTITKIRQGLNYSASKLVDGITLWLLIGLGFAALVQAYVPSDFLAQWGDGLLAMLVMVVISIPMYICATASTPIAAGLLLAGVSPGAVLVFMLAGPATNIATLGVVNKEMGKRTLLSYLTGVIGGAMLCGYLVDLMVKQFDILVMPQIGPEHELLPHWLTLSAGAVLAILMIISLVKRINKLKNNIPSLKLISN